MLIAICVLMCAVFQVAGLWLIAKALGPEFDAIREQESAMIHPTVDSDYGGLV